MAQKLLSACTSHKAQKDAWLSEADTSPNREPDRGKTRFRKNKWLDENVCMSMTEKKKAEIIKVQMNVLILEATDDQYSQKKQETCGRCVGAPERSQK